MKIIYNFIRQNPQITEFAFDTCHKIYLLESDRQKEEALHLGYEVLPINQLAETYEKSCPLKFIDFWDTTKPSLIEQQS